MKGLTKAQSDTLKNIATWEHGRPVLSAHITYAPLRRLIRRGLVGKVPGRGGCAYFAITEAGRQALTQGSGE